MSLVTSFVVFWQPLAIVMTSPSFANAILILTGWVFAPRRTITCMIAAAGAVGRKHHSAFHRLFAQACWSLDRRSPVVSFVDRHTLFLAPLGPRVEFNRSMPAASGRKIHKH